MFAEVMDVTDNDNNAGDGDFFPIVTEMNVFTKGVSVVKVI